MIHNSRGPVVSCLAKSFLFVTVLLCTCVSIYAQSPVPLVNLPLVPDAAAPGGSSFTLTVNGTAFSGGAVVHWNGSALVTEYISSSQLTATVPAANIAKASTASVTVVNPDGETSNVAFFAVMANQGNSVAFSGPSSIAVGKHPYGIAVADANNDGTPDLVVTNSSDATVSILLGDGKGSFSPGSTIAISNYPIAVATGDFNGDGNVDLAVAQLWGGGVTIALGDGTGKFVVTSTPQTNLSYSYWIIAADFNGDGKLDLAMSGMYTGTVSILLGDGTGNFSPGNVFGGGSAPYSVAAGDFNQDGNLDLAVGNYGGADMLVLTNDGQGNFNNSLGVYFGCEPLTVAVADVNADGKLDIVAADDVCALVTSVLGDGTGNFNVLDSQSFGSGPIAIIPGDFNGDSHLDFVIPNWPAGNVSVLLGDGTGKYTVAATPNAGYLPQNAVVADFNGDGLLDIAVANYGSNDVSVLLQTPPAPAVTLSTMSLAFGTQLIGTASAQSVTLTNTGSSVLTISGITGSVNFTQTNNCGTSLAAGASCTITVTFQPKGTGTLTGTITINDNAANNPQTVSASGVGTSVTLLPSSLSFGGQTVGTTSKPKAATLTNYGKKPLRISGIHISGANPANFAQSNNCGTSLAAGSACTISITFTPKSKGSKTATLTVADDGGASPQSIALSGVGR